MSFTCAICGTDSGTSLVCEGCRPELSGSLLKDITTSWHDLVVAPAFDPKRKRYRCFHCGNWFERQKVCGDHWPHTKAARPELRFDVSAGVCSCAGCNTSGNSNRVNPKTGKKEPIKGIPKKLCTKCRFRLAVNGDRCPFC